MTYEVELVLSEQYAGKYRTDRRIGITAFDNPTTANEFMNHLNRIVARELNVFMTITEMRIRLDAMHKIVNPGEYGLGSEPSSIPDDDKAAWERMGQLIDELQLDIIRLSHEDLT